jgi:hypothetical protein
MTWQMWSVLPVWVLSLAGAIVIGVTTTGDDYLIWLPIVLAGAVIVTFVIQLATQRSEGFVGRAMASIGVSIVILAVATGILALVR